MGPINDEQGLEQGGVNSSDLYKIVNNEQLTVPNETDFGVKLIDTGAIADNCDSAGDIRIASIGQADDTVLLSNDLVNLQFLLQLTLNFCSKYHIQLSPTKTKLQAYFPSNFYGDKHYLLNSVPITIGDSTIKFVDVAEHVGIVRSVDGNLPHILNRISSHSKALHAVLPAGLARAHRGNPIAALRVEKLYGVPVLMSGTAALVLKQTEVNILNQHYKNTLQRLLKIHDRSPDPVVYFLAGSLPAVATLHLKQLSLLSMISRLPNNILNRIGRHVLTVGDDRTKSWFLMVRDICLLNQLPHPLSQLDSPLPKEAAKQLFRAAVIDYWETKLRTDAALLPSLQYFKPQFMSLNCPHPIYQTCGSNSYEICKAIVQAKMVSGRYRTDRLVRHFYPDSDGNCSICPENVPGTIEHILTVSLSE